MRFGGRIDSIFSYNHMCLEKVHNACSCMHGMIVPSWRLVPKGLENHGRIANHMPDLHISVRIPPLSLNVPSSWEREREREKIGQEICHTDHMFTPAFPDYLSSYAVWIDTALRGFRDELLRCCFLVLDLCSSRRCCGCKVCIIGHFASQAMMPWSLT